MDECKNCGHDLTLHSCISVLQAERDELRARLEEAREAWEYVMRFVLCADAAFVEKYKQLTTALSDTPIVSMKGD